jgi:photosystem II stability/assembly factor-like uncharacterized protein
MSIPIKWEPLDLEANNSDYTAVSNSSDGEYCLASINNGLSSNGFIYYSSDYGKNWTQSLNGNWTCVSMSSTGQYCIAGINIGSIYYSSDFGQTWSPQTGWTSSTTGVKNWVSVSISSDGQYGFAGATDYNIVKGKYNTQSNIYDLANIFEPINST